MRIIRVDQDKTLDKEWDGMVLGIWLLAIAGAAYQSSVEKKNGDVLRQNIRIDASLRVWLTAKTQRQVFLSSLIVQVIFILNRIMQVLFSLFSV